MGLGWCILCSSGKISRSGELCGDSEFTVVGGVTGCAMRKTEWTWTWLVFVLFVEWLLSFPLLFGELGAEFACSFCSFRLLASCANIFAF